MQGGTHQCKVLGPKSWCVLTTLGRGSLWWSLSRGSAAGRGEPGTVLPGSTTLVPGPCSTHLKAAASPVLEWHLSCMGESHLWGQEPPTWLCGWRDSPPNALYFPLCRLLQQMTRSQQMDELLDVLIESGGTHCSPVPPQGFPSKPASVRGAQCTLCIPAELPELSTAFICPPCASSNCG